MREIKFRVWDSISKAYHYWGNIQNNKFNDFDLNHYTLEQYTGLKDNKGNNIFEGDIKVWKFNNYVWYYEYYWSDLDCGFRWKMLKHNKKQDLTDNMTIHFDNEEDYYKYVMNSNQRQNGFDSFSEIIGNIHQNPELIK
jgi:uncharacterized phage protein (TIGR01671 family)